LIAKGNEKMARLPLSPAQQRALALGRVSRMLKATSAPHTAKADAKIFAALNKLQAKDAIAVAKGAARHKSREKTIEMIARKARAKRAKKK
jgi:hypothetical protein